MRNHAYEDISFWNIPNFLTLLRILLLFPTLFFIFEEEYLTAFVFFSISCLTDFLDGFLARHLNSKTSLGEIADPIADKVFTSSVLIAMLYRHLFDPISVIVIIGREELVTGMRVFAATKKKVISAKTLGKLKTTLIMLSIGFALLSYRALGEALLIVSAAVAVYSAFIYFLDYLRG